MDNSTQNTHNVVTMTDYQADTGYSALSQVEGYWDALRGTRLMPKRAEIDPRGIESALEYTFILERIAPGMARLRIAGSHLGDLMGMEVRGMPISSFITPDGRRQVSDTLEEVFQRPAVCEMRLSAEASFDKPQMDARILLLPLKSDLGDVSRILGCMVARGEIGRSPRRFDLVGVKIRPITAPATLPTSEAEPKPVQPARPLVKGFAEPEQTYQQPKPASEVPYLRLVKNDD